MKARDNNAQFNRVILFICPQCTALQLQAHSIYALQDRKNNLAVGNMIH